jgi:transcriptional regulator GlxA family with amidase domain
MASKTSAVADEPIEVLIALHDKFDLMDFAGSLEVLTTALHDAKDPSELTRLVFVCQPRTIPRGRSTIESWHHSGRTMDVQSLYELHRA